MLNIMIVDDELLSVAYLEGMLKNIHTVKIVGSYSTTHGALTQLKKEKIDVIFLDVHLSGETNMRFAREIARLYPHIKMIFVTRFKQFAVEAFEIGVFDYLLKPIDKQYVKKTITRLLEERLFPSTQTMVHMFKQLSIYKKGQEIQDINWRTAKSKELFLYLLHYRNEIVEKKVLAKVLWPHLPRNKAYNLLYNTIYFIRNTLKSIDAEIEILNFSKGYLLELNGVVLDVDEWLKIMDKGYMKTKKNFNESEKLIHLYAGDYLQEENYPWLIEERRKLRDIHISFILELLMNFLKSQSYSKAEYYALKLQNEYPYLKEAYLLLIYIYAKTNDTIAFDNQYEKLTATMKHNYYLKSKDEILTWCEKWLENGNRTRYSVELESINM